MIEFINNNLAFVLFVLFLSIFLYIKRKNLAVSGAFPLFYMLMYKTTWGLDKMTKWSNKHKKLFLYLAYLSTFIGIVGMFASFIFMIWQLGFILDNGLTQGGGLVLPLKTDSGLDGAVPVFYVPFLYWIIALFILAIVHEFAHGVISERFKVKVKSSGFAFMGLLAPILPAAFVEPDEKQLNKKPWWQKIAVMGAGSTSNFIFGFLFLGIWLTLAAPLIDNTMEVDDIVFQNVMNQSELYGQINSGKIISLNGETNNELILNNLKLLKPNEQITLEIENENQTIKNFSIKTFENLENAEKGMVGISGLKMNLRNKENFKWLGNFPIGFERSLFWIWFLNLAIGIMNLLPLGITDGGQVAKTLFPHFLGKKIGLRIYRSLSWICLILIIFTMYPSLLHYVINLI